MLPNTNFIKNFLHITVHKEQRHKTVMKMAFKNSDCFLFTLWISWLLPLQSLLHIKVAQSGSILRKNSESKA